MNLTMVEHQRSILAVLGIDVWVPKTDVSIHSYTPSIYRDQAEPDVGSYGAYADAFSTTPISVVEKSRPAPSFEQNTSLANIVELEAALVVKKVAPEEGVVAKQHVQLNSSFENINTPIHVEPFVLHALSTPDYVIALDATQLDDTQLNLWKNIQLAAAGQFQELKWPFPLSQFQDGRGAKSYLQGFFDALCIDKKLICLGALPLADLKKNENGENQASINTQISIDAGQATSIVQLHTLQEMIDQPQHKRALWQHMRSV